MGVGSSSNPTYIDPGTGLPIQQPNSIKTIHLNDGVPGKYDLPLGKYGQSQYGRCRYSPRYGIYGFDKYGQCQYR